MKHINTSLLKFTGILIVIGFLMWLQSVLLSSDMVRDIGITYGYLGLFLISVVSGFNVLIPIPAIAFYPLFIELGFSAAFIVVIVSFGMVVGDSLGYLLGKTGKELLGSRVAKKIKQWLQAWEERHRLFPYLFLFLYAAVSPLPNELLVIPMAFAGYRYLPMLLMLFLGNVVFNILGIVGVMSIFSLFAL